MRRKKYREMNSVALTGFQDEGLVFYRFKDKQSSNNDIYRFSFLPFLNNEEPNIICGLQIIAGDSIVEKETLFSQRIFLDGQFLDFPYLDIYLGFETQENGYWFFILSENKVFEG